MEPEIQPGLETVTAELHSEVTDSPEQNWDLYLSRILRCLAEVVAEVAHHMLKSAGLVGHHSAELEGLIPELFPKNTQ